MVFLLFHTRIGQWLLRQLEQHCGLAIVPADLLDRVAVTDDFTGLPDPTITD